MLRHFAFFRDTFRDAGRTLLGPDQVAWLRRLQMEQENIRAALDWSLSSPTLCGAGAEFVAALIWLWTKRALFREGRLWLERAATIDAPPATRAWLLIGLSRIDYFQGRLTAAEQDSADNSTMLRSCCRKRSRRVDRLTTHAGSRGAWPCSERSRRHGGTPRPRVDCGAPQTATGWPGRLIEPGSGMDSRPVHHTNPKRDGRRPLCGDFRARAAPVARSGGRAHRGRPNRHARPCQRWRCGTARLTRSVRRPFLPARFERRAKSTERCRFPAGSFVVPMRRQYGRLKQGGR